MIDREDLYEQAILLTERATDFRDDIRDAVDLALDSRPEPQRWDVLREAVKIIEDRTQYYGPYINPANVHDLADRLEAEHEQEREKAAADAKREALIEKALDKFVARYKDSGLRMDRPNRLSPVYIAFEAAYDAGLLADEEADQ